MKRIEKSVNLDFFVALMQHDEINENLKCKVNLNVKEAILETRRESMRKLSILSRQLRARTLLIFA